ncbi:hypothetical protein FXF70_04365 [Bacillus sp. Y3]|nr:hypothetical protein FXF70_04365 [Bacillus sp. Y3]
MLNKKRRIALQFSFQRVDKPSHSLSVLRSGAHECQIRSAILLFMIMSRFLEYEVEALISIAAVLHPARSFYDTKGWLL